MEKIPREKRNISVAKAIEILKKEGIETDMDTVNEVLDFMYMLACIHYSKIFSDG